MSLRPGREWDSFSLYTRLARRSDTGHSGSHMPQPIHWAASTKGRGKRTKNLPAPRLPGGPSRPGGSPGSDWFRHSYPVTLGDGGPCPPYTTVEISTF